MMQGETYIKAKQRMLMVAEVADLLLRSPDKLRFDEDTYKVVAEALAWNRDDVRALFAEMDMLRATLGLPVVPEGKEPDARPEGDDTLGGVPPAQDGDGGGEARDHGAADGGRVQGSGVDGKRAKRPKSRRNKKGNAGSPEGLDPGNPPEQMGGDEGRAG
jgi:hypothetical protein